ncbi:GntR family transcriptional regulator [Ktedonosporobacter rubrisoli]|uniref:GntR family transcriptional regulator n=1 Tax=Ktedonosporobacter rubrisoli TaxID=2509675 RepID=A0A4P6JS83_KTERU|nr:GntR family transcriptional regulator [Ktedonosporobacter rubrisoli]QBD78052.1 GntR family transcriptional regulator [Ktedonosporobacter rubrisoli]
MVQKSEKGSRTKALYTQILDEFRERIISGEFAAGDRLPTELEIAKRYHSSRGTVRQALSALVNEGFLERIQGSGTFVRQHATSPAQEQKDQASQQAPKSIGLILSRAGDELNIDILLGVEQAAKSRGYQLSFAYAEEDARELAQDIERLRASTEGLVIFPLSDVDRDESLAQLKAERVPFVLVDRYIAGLDCDYVTSDNLGGGYRATEHLLILGHTRIGFVSRNGLLTTSVRDRWEGYRKALNDYGRAYDESLIYIAATRKYGSYDDIVTSSNRPDAIFAVNDDIALALMQAAQRHNISVPEDLALVGFDDVSYAALVSTPLTTVAQQRVEMGLHAGTLLINHIEGQTIGTRHIELPANLIIRQSCGARRRVSSLVANEETTRQ